VRCVRGDHAKSGGADHLRADCAGAGAGAGWMCASDGDPAEGKGGGGGAGSADSDSAGEDVMRGCECQGGRIPERAESRLEVCGGYGGGVGMGEGLGADRDSAVDYGECPMSMRVEEAGTGMFITRHINGERVRLDNLDQKTKDRIDMLVEMDTKRKECESRGDWQGLVELAQMYEDQHMNIMAAMIRQEAETHGSKANLPDRRAASADRRGQWGGPRKKGGVPATADSVHAGTATTDSRPMPSLAGTRQRKKMRTKPDDSV